MAAHFSVLAWRIPWTEEPGGATVHGAQSWTRLKRLGTHPQWGVREWLGVLRFMGSKRVGHD